MNQSLTIPNNSTVSTKSATNILKPSMISFKVICSFNPRVIFIALSIKVFYRSNGLKMYIISVGLVVTMDDVYGQTICLFLKSPKRHHNCLKVKEI